MLFVKNSVLMFNSLFQALCQWRTEKASGRRVGSGREKGEIPLLSLPDPARRWSRSSPARFFDRPHWPRAWNRLMFNFFCFDAWILISNEESDENNVWFGYDSQNTCGFHLGFHWVSKLMHVTNLAIFYWLSNVWIINEFEKYIYNSWCIYTNRDVYSIVQFRIRLDRWLKALRTQLYRVNLDLK